MVPIEISFLNVAERHGQVTANALAPEGGVQMWMCVEFERGEQEPKKEAYDRVLAVLDMS